MPRRSYTPFELGVVSHFVKEQKPPPPKESWWTAPKTFAEFTTAAKARDQVMGWSAHGRGGRNLRTMYEDWSFTR